MTNKEALIKTFIWRLLIAVPLSFILTYLYFDEFYKSLELTIVIHLISTVLYYLYDMFWFNGDKLTFWMKTVWRKSKIE